MSALTSWLRGAVAGSVILLAVSPADAARLTYPDLVDRLVNLEHLALPPLAGERGEQCSSYDRASRWDAGKQTYVGWDANGDGDGCIRKEGDRIVMAEIDGPGCVWRIMPPSTRRTGGCGTAARRSWRAPRRWRFSRVSSLATAELTGRS